MKSLRAVAALLLSAPAWAGVQYYLTDSLSSIDSFKWTTSGSLAPATAVPVGGRRLRWVPDLPRPHSRWQQ